jgi:plastocyanin
VRRAGSARAPAPAGVLALTRRCGALAALALTALALTAPRAAAVVQEVGVQFQAFGPSVVDVLPGETVAWSNVSDRRHTVTSDTGLFDSGDLQAGDRFTWQFDEPGAFAYHCTVHAGMVGEVDVRRVILGPLPTAAIPAGDRVEVTGRTAAPSAPVQVQRSEDGTRFTTVATAVPGADGTWTTNVTATTTADYRAVVGDDASQTRRLAVSDRKVLLTATRDGVRVTVTPSKPYARIMLQQDERERFGWWPVAVTRLDYVSQASLPLTRHGRVRALLVDKDGWTPLATSRVLSFRGGRR